MKSLCFQVVAEHKVPSAHFVRTELILKGFRQAAPAFPQDKRIYLIYKGIGKPKENFLKWGRLPHEMGYHRFTSRKHLEKRIGKELGLKRIAPKDRGFQVLDEMLTDDLVFSWDVLDSVELTKLRAFKISNDKLLMFYLDAEDMEMAKTLAKNYYANVFELHIIYRRFEDFVYSITFHSYRNTAFGSQA